MHGRTPRVDRCASLVAAAAKGVSLHIGLNSVDPAAYNNWSGELIACENDAHSMEAIAKVCACCAGMTLMAAHVTHAELPAAAVQKPADQCF
jgi:hypothetical protein